MKEREPNRVGLSKQQSTDDITTAGRLVGPQADTKKSQQKKRN